jgi:uncharacterized protein (TIGR00251 family)
MSDSVCSQLIITEHPEGSRLEVRVKPRASRTAIVGVRDGILVVSLAAPPVDGQANDTLLKALSKWTRLPVRSLTLLTGAKSKNKLILFSGLSANALRTVLLPLFPSPPSA